MSAPQVKDPVSDPLCSLGPILAGPAVFPGFPTEVGRKLVGTATMEAGGKKRAKPAKSADGEAAEKTRKKARKAAKAVETAAAPPAAVEPRLSKKERKARSHVESSRPEASATYASCRRQRESKLRVAPASARLGQLADVYWHWPATPALFST